MVFLNSVDQWRRRRGVHPSSSRHSYSKLNCNSSQLYALRSLIVAIIRGLILASIVRMTNRFLWTHARTPTIKAISPNSCISITFIILTTYVCYISFYLLYIELFYHYTYFFSLLFYATSSIGIWYHIINHAVAILINVGCAIPWMLEIL